MASVEMTTASNPAATDDLRRSWFWFFGLGLLMIVGSGLALHASLAVEIIAGAFFFAAGVTELTHVDGWRGLFIWSSRR